MKNKLLDIINQDIHTQKKYLSGDFDKDKSLNWRIIGMRYIKQQIKRMDEKEVKKDE